MNPTAPRSRDLSISLIIAAIWGWQLLVQYWNHSPPDMAALYFAGYFFDIGRFDLIYDAQANIFMGGTTESWKAAFGEIGYGGKTVYPFVYPPIWAAILSIPAQLDPIVFFRLSYILQLPLIPVSIFFAWRIMGKIVPLAILMLMMLLLLRLSVFGLFTFSNNQPAILITFLLLLWLDQSKRGNHKVALAAIIIASAIKIYPAALMLVYLLNKQYRLLGWYIAIIAAIVALSFILAGPELHWIFIETIQRISSLVFVTSPVFGVETLLAQIQYMTNLDAIEGLILEPPQYQEAEPLWITILTSVIFVSAIIFLVRKFQSAGHEWRTIAFPIALFVLVPLCGPLGWIYHYLPVVFLAPAIAIFWGKWTAYVVPLLIFISVNVSLQRLLEGIAENVNFWQATGTVTMILLFLTFALAPDPKPST